MSKEIFKEDFWKDRIVQARRAGTKHYSVYLAHQALWQNIGNRHRKICDKFVKGKVLDAGCGYGRLRDWFDDYTGVDFSPDFIEWANEAYPSGNSPFVQADLRNLPFKDKEFDWAICVSIKKMVIDNKGEEAWEEMETELKRVAHKILVLEYEYPDQFEIL